MSYDSTEDTLAHITVVQGYLHDVASGLTYRGRVHDRSKLADPEKATFDEYTPRLASLTYSTPEYKQALVEMARRWRRTIPRIRIIRNTGRTGSAI